VFPVTWQSGLHRNILVPETNFLNRSVVTPHLE
jgi:hypothetical protein